MADPIPWLDEVKRTGKLTIALDESIGKQGWAKAFRDSIAKFNELRLGVTYEQTDNQAKANVIAQAKVGDFEFGYDDGHWVMAKKPRLYDLRYSYLTMSYIVGKDLRATQRMAMHSSSKMTDRYTLAAVDPRLHEVAALITARMAGKVSPAGIPTQRNAEEL